MFWHVSGLLGNYVFRAATKYKYLVATTATLFAISAYSAPVFAISGVSANPSSVTVDEGQSQSVTVSVDTTDYPITPANSGDQPSLYFTIGSSDSHATTNTNEITFDNSGTPQSFTVNTTDDGVVNNGRSATITLIAHSNDPNYDSYSLTIPVTMNNIDTAAGGGSTSISGSSSTSSGTVKAASTTTPATTTPDPATATDNSSDTNNAPETTSDVSNLDSSSNTAAAPQQTQSPQLKTVAVAHKANFMALGLALLGFLLVVIPLIVMIKNRPKKGHRRFGLFKKKGQQPAVVQRVATQPQSTNPIARSYAQSYTGPVVPQRSSYLQQASRSTYANTQRAPKIGAGVG